MDRIERVEGRLNLKMGRPRSYQIDSKAITKLGSQLQPPHERHCSR
jgi:hypothetical protein